MGGRRVVIRTLDAGADKQTDYFGLRREENPALGMRGVRFCLSRPEMFLAQLRAVYRASAFGNVSALFPMIASVWEARECRRLCEAAMEQLRQRGLEFNPRMETGLMIETPASVMIADGLAREADFFSVGTNDLTQYMLACDRQSDGLERHCDPRHPAVLRAVKMAADAAHRAGIRIGVCGEMASDKSLLPALIAMGIDEVSVPPAQVLAVRAEIRKQRAGECSAEEIL
jgi:phosphotransferase system enzyme I (PtsI)